MSQIGFKIFGTNWNLEFMPWQMDHNLYSTLSNYHEVYDNIQKRKYDEKAEDVSILEIEKWLTKY